MNYGYSKVTGLSFAEARTKVEEELKKEGFGILSEIDVKATMKMKLDKDIRPYLILGACNPPYAYQALQAEEEIGLLMPCNVIVYENEAGKTVVSAMEVGPVMGIVGNPKIDEFAPQIQEKIHKVIDSV